MQHPVLAQIPTEVNLMDILDRIIQAKRARIKEQEEQTPLSTLSKMLDKSRPSPTKKKPLLSPDSFQVIAEIKRASPSKGILPWHLSLEEYLQAYEAGKAAVISVLTEEDFFLGSAADLQKVRSITSLPLLRKDFIISEYQVLESAVLGADMLLLIPRILSPLKLKSLLNLARELELEALVECSDERDIALALEAGARVLGINNRDLGTFEITLERTRQLSSQIPQECILVSESGIHTPKDAALVSSYGAHAVLVGESCLLAPDPLKHIRSLLEAGQKVKEGSSCPK